MTADDHYFELGQTLYQVARGQDGKWEIVEHETAASTHSLVEHEGPHGSLVAKLFRKRPLDSVFLDNIQHLFREYRMAKDYAIDRLLDDIDDLNDRIDNLREVPAWKLEDGDQFRKAAGGVIFIRLSEASCKALGLSSDDVWGIGAQCGGLTRVSRDTQIIPVGEIA